jgi:CRP/FNR family cyclic AMP-dependent transcriptional regulator
MRSSLIFLSFLNDADVAWIVQVCRKRNLSPGEVLIERGAVNKDIYLLLEGKCSITAANNLILGEVVSGDLIGEVSYVDERRTNAQVRAQSSVVLAHLSALVLNGKMQADLGFASRFYQGVASVLAFRLRRNLQATFDQKSNLLSSSEEFESEIDSKDLDTTARSGARLDFMLKALIAS